jgi:hypothetical protein
MHGENNAGRVNPREKYHVDRVREAAGAVLTFDDMTFTCRSATDANRGFKYALSIAAWKRRNEIKNTDATAFDVHESLVIEAFADAVVLAWSGVDDDKGEPIPFSRDACISLFEDCPKIWAAVREFAQDDSKYRPVREDGETLGKS